MYWCTCISSWYRQPAAQAARPGLLVAGAHAACRAGPEQRRQGLPHAQAAGHRRRHLPSVPTPLDEPRRTAGFRISLV